MINASQFHKAKFDLNMKQDMVGLGNPSIEIHFMDVRIYVRVNLTFN